MMKLFTVLFLALWALLAFVADGSQDLPDVSTTREDARASSSRSAAAGATITRTTTITPSVTIMVISERPSPNRASGGVAGQDSWAALKNSVASHGNRAASSGGSSSTQPSKAAPGSAALNSSTGNNTCPANDDATVTTTNDNNGTCPAQSNATTTVLGSSFLPQETQSRWGDGWWIDSTTWVTCSPACFGLTDLSDASGQDQAPQLAGHPHPVAVVGNESCNTSSDRDARRSQFEAPQPLDNTPSMCCASFSWGGKTDARSLLVGNSSCDALSTTSATTVSPSEKDGSVSRAMRILHWILVLSTLFSSAGCLHAATRPRQHGGRVLPDTQEDLPYWQRLLAVVTLFMACGGATLIYLFWVVYSATAVWVYRGSAVEGYLAITCFLGLVVLYMIPLKVYKRGVPISRFAHPILKLWREYFGFSYEVDGTSDKKRPKANKKSHRRKAPTKGQRRRRRKGETYMIAQMPHGFMPFGSLLGIGILAEVMDGLYPMGGVVADALLMVPMLRRAVNWLGVRRASFENIMQMFADGFKAVGVVSGGIAEMFLSWTKERIVAPRPNFARLALQGGHDVVLVFAYGVSRTHKNRFSSEVMSKKAGLPVMIAHGPFMLVPYRETLRMIVSKPISVTRVAHPTDDDITSLRKQIEAEMTRLYYEHLPEWESRPLQIVRAASSTEELELHRR